MLVNLIFAIIMDPKESLNNHVVLAFLGSVSDKLKVKCEWSNEAYAKAVQACVRKNKLHRKDSFVSKFFDPTKKQNGQFVRLIVAEIADITLPSEFFEDSVYPDLLDVSFKFFNASDSFVALLASEMADLHLNEKGMTTFDAFDEKSLRIDFEFLNKTPEREM